MIYPSNTIIFLKLCIQRLLPINPYPIHLPHNAGFIPLQVSEQNVSVDDDERDYLVYPEASQPGQQHRTSVESVLLDYYSLIVRTVGVDCGDSDREHRECVETPNL